MLRSGFTREDKSERETPAPRRGARRGDAEAEHGPVAGSRAAAGGDAGPSLLSAADLTRPAHDARRAELLTRLQRTHGNAYVKDLVGGRIIAARGHNSPPASGPGSHGEPLVAGRGASQRVDAMRTDAYYRSPVNPHHPVVVWTDGASLFFAPSHEQVTGGRAVQMPEPVFVPPPGYRAEEIQWDRREGLLTGIGPLVIVARKAGAPDVNVGVTNTLEQRSFFAETAGLTQSASMYAAREGGQFLQADDTKVPEELSGAGAPGEIHGKEFTDGFLRYHAPGGSHDFYVARGANSDAYLVERATGKITQNFAAGNIATIAPERNGVVHLETTTGGAGGAGGAATTQTTTIDLRKKPATVTSAAGHASAESGYADARARLEALNVSIKETGVRLRVAELEAIESALTAGGGRGLAALRDLRTLEEGREVEPDADPDEADLEEARLKAAGTLLKVWKKIGPDDARGSAYVGYGIPSLTISEPFDASSAERVSTVRHEMTHVLMEALDAVRRAKLSLLGRADLEASLRFEARGALEKARGGLLRASEYGPGDVRPGPGSFGSWRSAVGEDPALANVWVELLRRYGFIQDPEGTAEVRGVALADESRYSGASEIGTGHPSDNVGEFTASFVASATVFRQPFIDAVLAAETAGNARGGGGGSYLRRLYGRAWTLIDATYVPLGPNPF